MPWPSRDSSDELQFVELGETLPMTALHPMKLLNRQLAASKVLNMCAQCGYGRLGRARFDKKDKARGLVV